MKIYGNIIHQLFFKRCFSGYGNPVAMLILLLFMGNQSMAQKDILDYFNATETNGQVFLKWSISSGETCNGIKITRSSDTLAFHQIGEIAGVCGEADVPVPYSFLDEAPIKNTLSYYRLELGISNFSKTISVSIVDKNEAGYQVRPNPIRDKGTIYFNNPGAESWEFLLFSVSGALLYKSTTSADFVEVNVYDIPSGLVFFLLSSSQKNIKGKIISLPNP
jgi:hypothetical protein